MLCAEGFAHVPSFTAHGMGTIVDLTAGDTEAQRDEVACPRLWRSLGLHPNGGKEEGRKEGIADGEMDGPLPLITKVRSGPKLPALLQTEEPRIFFYSSQHMERTLLETLFSDWIEMGPSAYNALLGPHVLKCPLPTVGSEAPRDTSQSLVGLCQHAGHRPCLCSSERTESLSPLITSSPGKSSSRAEAARGVTERWSLRLASFNQLGNQRGFCTVETCGSPKPHLQGFP